MLYEVITPVCESGDFFGKNIPLPALEHNDLLAIYSAGAYGFTMASNYNTRSKPAEVAIEGEDVRLIRQRETFEDQIRVITSYSIHYTKLYDSLALQKPSDLGSWHEFKWTYDQYNQEG